MSRKVPHWRIVLRSGLLCLMIAISVSLFSLTNSNVASAQCGWSDTCEPGNAWDGGSLVQGYMRYRNSGNNVIPYMDFYIVPYSGHSLGCYKNLNGEGYLIKEVRPAVFKGSDGHTVSTASTRQGFRLAASFGSSRWVGSVDFNAVNKYTMHAGVTYDLDSSYWRRHICSVENDAPVVGIKAVYRRNNEWSINGQSYVGNPSNGGNAGNRGQGENVRTARPGQTYQWDHDLRNNGPDNMPSNISVNVDYQTRSLDNGKELTFKSTGMGGHKGNNGVLFYITHNKRTITQDDVGKKLCQRIAWQKKSWNDGGWGVSNYACINVPYHYTMHGTTNVGGSLSGGKLYENNTARFTYNIKNDGPTKSRGFNWRTYFFVLPGNASINTNPRTFANFDQASCWQGGSEWKQRTCRQVGSGSSNLANGASMSPSPYDYTLTQANYIRDGIKDGDKLCSYVAFDNWSYNNGTSSGNVRTSNVKCVSVYIYMWNHKSTSQVTNSTTGAKGQSVTARPGNQVYFDHGLYNLGRDNMIRTSPSTSTATTSGVPMG